MAVRGAVVERLLHIIMVPNTAKTTATVITVIAAGETRLSSVKKATSVAGRERRFLPKSACPLKT